MLSWRTKWQITEQVRNSIWIVPAIFVVLAIALGVALPNLDSNSTDTLGLEFGAGAAQGMLGAMAGGMITFTGFVFSILLLAVQFGSSQFSPRMLRRFLRDPTTKIALGTFMATFVYALLVLRTIEPRNNQDFVPDDSVSVAIIMLLLSMVMFLRLISRTTQGLRVAAVLRDLGRDGSKVIANIYPDSASRAEPMEGAAAREAPAGGTRKVLYDGEAGILQSLDRHGLVGLAAEAEARVELLRPVGDLIMPGTPIFAVHGDGGRISDRTINQAVAVGDERTMKQDPAFVFRLLADISAKALSPGVNDPTTSVQAIDQIEILLVQLATKRLAPGELRDSGGVVRLTYPTPSWSDFLSIALDETRMFGEGSVQISRRMRALLEDLREIVPPERLEAVDQQLARLQVSIGLSFSEDGDRHIAGTRDRQGIGSPLEPTAPVSDRG